MGFKDKLQQLRFARAFFRFVDNPERTEELFKMVEPQFQKPDYSHSPVLRAMADHLQTQPEFMKLWQEKYLPALPRPSELKKFPEGSLGRVYADHMLNQGLDPDFYPTMQPRSLVHYLAQRMRQTHDLWHVLTGYSTSYEDEIRLQGFTLGQIKTGFPVMVLAAGLLHTLRTRPQDATALVEAYYESYRWGCQARFLPGVRLEDRLREPLVGLQVEFGLVRG